MYVVRRFAAVALGFLLLGLAIVPVPASAQADINAVPSRFAAGARIKVTTEGLVTSASYRLRLEQVSPGTADLLLQNFSTTTNTRPTLSVTIPESAVPGAWEIVLYRIQLTQVRVASTRVDITTSPGVVLVPTTAAPRKSVRITVSNLVAGAVRVTYAGSTILGPATVGAGTWSSKFVVPGDRPPNLPADVPVVVENLVGRTVVGRTTVNFRALAPSGLPRLRVALTQAPTTTLDPATPFMLGGRLQTDVGLAPQGRQSLYWRDAGGRVIPLDDSINIGTDGTFAMSARAPGRYSDGYGLYSDRSGELMIVNQGIDIDTDSRWDSVANNEGNYDLEVDGRDSPSRTFTIVVRGDQPGGNDPLLEGVYVEAQEEYESAFGYAGRSVLGGSSGAFPLEALVNERQGYFSTNANQLRAFVDVAVEDEVSFERYGCDVTPFRRRTNANGEAIFNVNTDSIEGGNVIDPCQIAECRPPTASQAAVPGAPKGSNVGLTGFVLSIYSAHLGYRSRGIALGFDEDTGDLVNTETGQTVPGNRLEVLLERTQTTDFDLRNLRIDGIGAPMKRPPGDCESFQAGECYYTPNVFGTMYTYPNTSKWPNSAFDRFNTGRKVRLEVDPTVTGTMNVGRIRINNGPTQLFSLSGTPGCVLDQTTPLLEYVATLPDLTRLPVAGVMLDNGTILDGTGVATGGIDGVIELRFGASPLRVIPFKLSTQRPPSGIEIGNGSIATLRIDGFDDRVYGTYNVRDVAIPVSSPGYGIGNLDNGSENTGEFDFRRTPDSVAAEYIDSVSNNDVAGEPGGPREAAGKFFGFTNSNYNTPEQVTLFDTGRIPLFRYIWTIPPIASATLGADFWMASYLAFYGEMRTQGMNATIDPTLSAGVDLFFDLDVLAGLVSGTIAAETEFGVVMRSVINQGGKAHLGISQQSGECFKFDLDAVWEACAVGICGGGTEELIREREPNGCDSSADLGLPLSLRAPQPDNFDLGRPRLTASALASDQRGNTLAVGIDDNGALVATHMTGSSVTATRTIATRPVAVQHVDVAFYAANRAMAVWSENTRSETQVRDLMLAQGGRAFDDIVRTQRLRFSTYDGRDWSTPANLTSTGNDGKPQLAACFAAPRFALNCPVGGEITAVWERDANANLDAPDIEVWSATWDPGRAWSTPVRVSSTGTSSDMLPSAAYRNGTPIVAWAHNPSGHFANLGGRRVAYRFLDGSSAQVVATALGTGVGWVSIGVSPTDAVVIAYTRAQDAQGFVGNRQALYGARATTCSAGTCSFLVTEPRDGNGRQYRVERPSVAFDDDGTPIVGFRALGFGATTTGQFGLPGDTPGTLLGTGELGLVRVHSFAQPTYVAQFVPLSNNGLQHFKPEFVYDDTSANVVALSMEAPEPAGLSTPMRIAREYTPEGTDGIAQAQVLAGGATMRMSGGGPDFTLRDAVLSRDIVGTGVPLTIDLDLVNIGQAFDPAVHGSVQVKASWNAPVGAGIAAGTFALTATQAANANRDVTFPLTIPANTRTDERQTLFLDIVADDEANDIGGIADRVMIEVNAMPVPQAVRVDTRPNSSMVDITWTDDADPRIAGWRVWKRDEEGEWRHLGSTPEPGYIDLRGEPGESVQYRVAAYSANGMESEPSAPAYGTISVTLPDDLFGNGFEAPTP